MMHIFFTGGTVSAFPLSVIIHEEGQVRGSPHDRCVIYIVLNFVVFLEGHSWIELVLYYISKVMSYKMTNYPKCIKSNDRHLKFTKNMNEYWKYHQLQAS